ncbi:hypothetical protein ACFLUJ_07055 [Chloroflexota bacterium]
MMSKADLYLDMVNICSYWPVNATIPCEEFLARLKVGEADILDYPFLTMKQFQSFKLTLEAEKFLPSIPLLTIPQPMAPDLLQMNKPDRNSLVIVSGNSRLTIEVLATIWAQGVTSAYFLIVDCLGNTVDMAMVYGEFTPEKLLRVLKKSSLGEKVEHRNMIVPGSTSPLVRDFGRATNWDIEVGPVCAAELPLFLGDRWVFTDL